MISPSVVIIILNWNRLDDTLDCIKSLRQLNYERCEILVVDNGSTDGSVPMLQRQFPEVSLIKMKENIGYTGGNNAGLRYALARGADYALLLNNDTEVSPDCISLLVGAVEAMPQAGVAGPTIYQFDRRDIIWSAGRAIDWRRGDSRMMGLGELDEGQYDAIREVDFVTGCALLARREVLEDVGILDPRFCMYQEEIDQCVRVARAGYQILHAPRACVWHKISLTQQADSPRIHYYMTRNRLLILRTGRKSEDFGDGRCWFYWLTRCPALPAVRA